MTKIIKKLDYFYFQLYSQIKFLKFLKYRTRLYKTSNYIFKETLT